MSADFIFNLVAISASIATICLGILLLFKMEQIKKLKFLLDKLRKSFDELDEQAKLIVKTDLELNKTQEELDKKISGLWTLQRLSRAISTTLDENQIFERIEESLVRELGFEKAVAFALQKPTDEKDNAPRLTLRMQAGYSQDEAEKIRLSLQKENLLPAILKNNTPFSSLAPAQGNSNYARDRVKTGGQKRLEQIIETLKSICALSSFVSSLIVTKDGPYGLIIMGNESSFYVLTEGDEEFVAILANQLGQAIENAKLFEQTFRSHQELERRVEERTRELTVALVEIKQISKRKSEFVSAVSHELRTPLTSIKGYASILAAGKLGEIPNEAKERIEKINRHSNELTGLINNLLDISRIESGKVEMKIQPQNLSRLLETVADLFMPQIKDKQIQFSSNIPEDLEPVLVDSNQIERVFINLISNALKYTPTQGKIKVSADRRTDDYIRIDVSDSGCGIPQQDISKIFSEFYRVDSTMNQEIKGTGLGLSLVKYIVEAHTGEIWVTSEINQGSTFSFTLPISKPR